MSFYIHERISPGQIIRMTSVLKSTGLYPYFYGSKRLKEPFDYSSVTVAFELPNDDVILYKNTCIYHRARGWPILNLTRYEGLPVELQDAMQNALRVPVERVLTNVKEGTSPEDLLRLKYKSLCGTHEVADGAIFVGGRPATIEMSSRGGIRFLIS